MEIHQKKSRTWLKTLVKRSIEQNLRIKNFEARNWNYERNVVVKSQGTKQRGQRTPGDCWQWKAKSGSVPKETIAVSVTISTSAWNWHSRILLRVLSCSRVRGMRREPEVPEANVPVVECLDGPARITSKELAPNHFVKNGILQNACSTRPRLVVGLGRSAHSHTVRLMNSPAKGSKKNGDKKAVGMLKKI